MMGILNKMVLRSLNLVLILLLAVSVPLSGSANLLYAQDTPQTASANVAARPVGTIKSMSGSALVLTTDAGAEVTVQVQAAARLVRVAPGQKDLKDAAVIQLQDLQPGDRILVRGILGADGKSVLASSVVAMKKTDIADKQAREREEWQKQGIGGLVSAADPASETITIGTTSAVGGKNVIVHISKSTIVRRYAADSVKFDDAKLSSFDQIKPGDQVRARGSRSADGSEFSAVEIVWGAFRNIAGTVSSVDAVANSMTVEDLATRKSIQIKITPESQVRKLPPPMAQRIAMRLKGISPDAASAENASRPVIPPASPSPQSDATGNSSPAPGGGGHNGGAPDLQQAISRMPPASLADFQKGDAVMIVATQGSGDSQATAIILLGGVEPILSASPKGEAGSLLSPWSLSSGGGEGTTP